MTKLIALQAFSWAHGHVSVREYAPGEEIETDDADLIRVAVEEGWARAGDTNTGEPDASRHLDSEVKPRKAKERAANAAAPETKAD